MKLRVLLFLSTLLPGFLCVAQGQTDTICFTEKFSIHNDDETAVFSLGTATVEPSFKGGIRAWINFLNKNVSFGDIIKSVSDSTTNYFDSVVMKFIVSKSGKISDLEILFAGNDAIKEEAVRLLKLSCTLWRPAVASSGRNINAWHMEKLAIIIQRDGNCLNTQIGVMK